MELNELKKIMPYKFRVQQAKEWGAQCVAYIDSRDVQDLLDEVVGANNWQDKYYEVKGNLFCSIGIKCGDDWVYKTDCGSESNVEKQKGEASDAFKRAAVKWGIGRFLYSLGIPKLKTKDYKGKHYPCDSQGNILWDVESLTSHCNEVLGANAPSKPQKVRLPNKSEQSVISHISELLIDTASEVCRIPVSDKIASVCYASKGKYPCDMSTAAAVAKYLAENKLNEVTEPKE
jgi:hypothetical protein